MTTIGDFAFNSCSGLTLSLTIPSSVTSIGIGAFGGFGGLFLVDNSNPNYSSLDGILYNKDKTTLIQCPVSKTGSLIIPSSVTTIDYNACGYCSGITSIYTSATTPIDIIESSPVFSGVDKTIPLHVPVGSTALYAAADQWMDFTNIVDDIVPTSLNEVLSNSISIFPNPTTSTITISELGSLVSEKTVTISVVDALGSTLLVKDVETSLNTLTLDVSTFKNGIYFMVIQTSNDSVVKRFAKE